MISLIGGIYYKKMIQMNSLTKQTDSETETQKTISWLPKGKWQERDKLGIWD